MDGSELHATVEQCRTSSEVTQNKVITTADVKCFDHLSI